MSVKSEAHWDKNHPIDSMCHTIFNGALFLYSIYSSNLQAWTEIIV